MKSCVECEVDAGFVMTVCYDCANRVENQSRDMKEGGREGEERRLAMLPVL